jgi:glycosyltransferase involved in cell wall biosynthesis
MPAYNCEAYIKRAINSILNQDYKNFELLILDDASTDGTLEVIKSITDVRVKVFESKDNRGYLKSCNFLFRRSKGHFITFQDADDYSLSSRLKLQLSKFDTDSELFGVGCNYFRDFSHNQYFSNYPLKYNDILKYINEECKIPFCGASLMFKRDKIEGDLYLEYFSDLGFEDYFFILNKIKVYKFINIQNPLYHYTYNKTSITRGFYKDKRKLCIGDIIINNFNKDFSKSFYKPDLDFLKFEVNKNILTISDNLALNLKYQNCLVNYDFISFFKILFNARLKGINYRLLLLLIKQLIKILHGTFFK